MTEQIWVGEKLYKKLDENRSEGQSFAGYIKELIKNEEISSNS